MRQATFDGEVEYQTEMATYILFTVHTDDDDDDTDNDDDDTLIFYTIDKYLKKNWYPKQFVGVVVAHVLWMMVRFHGNFFLQCELKAASTREPRARSPSREGEARAHLLPRQGRARLPRPLGLQAAAPMLGLRAAAPIVRVLCGCPDS